MSQQEFQEYCAKIRDTAVWGGEPEIMALTKAYNIPIHVIQGQTPHIVVHSPTGDTSTPADENRVVRISYHRRMYGLGEVSYCLTTVAKNIVFMLSSIIILCDQNALYQMESRPSLPPRLHDTRAPSSI
jgi:hypothetical protein